MCGGRGGKVHAPRSCILVFLSPSRDRRHTQPLFEWRNGDTRCIEWMCWVTDTDRAVSGTSCSFSVPGEGPLLPVESNYCFCKNFLTVVKTWSVDAELGRLYAKNISDRLFGYKKSLKHLTVMIFADKHPVDSSSHREQRYSGQWSLDYWPTMTSVRHLGIIIVLLQHSIASTKSQFTWSIDDNIILCTV